MCQITCPFLVRTLCLARNVTISETNANSSIFSPVWAILYCSITLCFSRAMAILFNLPAWTVATVTCNNTTSLPLFLVQSLDSTGVLDSISSGNKNIADKLRSYFLVFAVANNIFTFGAGEPAMKGFSNEGFPFSALRKLREKIVGKTSNDEEAQGSDDDDEDDDDEQDGQRHQGSGHDGETTPLLPQNFIRWERRTKSRVSERAAELIEPLPEPVKKVLGLLRSFLTPTAFGATAGAIIGLVPALHKLFFDPMQEGGYFKGWLTSSLKNVGELFVTLQIIVVGVQLSLSLRSMKKGEDKGNVPWTAAVYVIGSRFVLMPL